MTAMSNLYVKLAVQQQLDKHATVVEQLQSDKDAVDQNSSDLSQYATRNWLLPREQSKGCLKLCLTAMLSESMK